MKINYEAIQRLASVHSITVDQARDQDGPYLHVHRCFAADRDRFLAALDTKYPGKYFREYGSDMTVWLRPY